MDKMQDDNKIAVKDIVIKIQKLEVFIKRAERRIDAHEKKLARLREEMKAGIKALKTKVMV